MIIKALALSSLMFMGTPAQSLEQNVRSKCMGDYFEFCSHTVPGTQNCKQCFIDVGPRLSVACREAIKNSQEYANDYKSQRKRYVRD